MPVSSYIFGFLTMLCAIGVVASRRPLNSALWLVTTLFLVAVHFALLGAGFLALVQILVYAGAIMVLIIFVLMLLGADQGERETAFSLPSGLVAIVCACFLLLIGFALYQGSSAPSLLSVPPQMSPPDGSVEAVGQALFTRFLFPFQIIGVLLLAAVIGAVVLVHEHKRPLPPGRGLRAMREKEHS